MENTKMPTITLTPRQVAVIRAALLAYGSDLYEELEFAEGAEVTNIMQERTEVYSVLEHIK